jgi:membrane protein implicated in regulation of membrane protease activity
MAEVCDTNKRTPWLRNSRMPYSMPRSEMLIYIYLFAFGLGGVLLLGSIFLGDKDTEAAGDTDAGDAEAGGGTQAQHFDHGVGDSHGTVAGLFTAFLSLRFWMFFLAFFGLTGLVLDGLDLVDSPSAALVAALFMGLVTGQSTVAVFRRLSHGETGTAASASDYVGRSGRVLVGFDSGGLGKLRLVLKGTTVDVLATTDDARPFKPGEEALVIAMNDTTAVVARVATGSN